jgi:hypothetical protein
VEAQLAALAEAGQVRGVPAAAAARKKLQAAAAVCAEAVQAVAADAVACLERLRATEGTRAMVQAEAARAQTLADEAEVWVAMAASHTVYAEPPLDTQGPPAAATAAARAKSSDMPVAIPVDVFLQVSVAAPAAAAAAAARGVH